MRRIRSSDSVKIISLDTEALLKDVRKIAARIIERHSEVQGIYIFGSIARGDYTGLSDVDVLIVLRHCDQGPPERIRSYLPYFDLPVGVDLLVYTEDELRSMEEQENPFIKRIKQEWQRIA